MPAVNARIAVLAALLLFGCSTAPKRHAAISRGIYATADALSAGRVDLADAYIHEVTKLVPPPKDRIKIVPFRANPRVRDVETPVVLPERFAGKPVIVENSPEYQELLRENAALRQQSAKDAAELRRYGATIDAARRDLAKVAEKSENKSHWFGWLTAGAGLVVVAIIALLILFPPLIPLFTSFLGSVFTGLRVLITRLWK